MNWDLLYRGETRNLDDAARAEAGGSFVLLPQGCTHYELAGPDGKMPAVLVHGFSAPYFVWDITFDTLKAAGSRVLRYDLLGRGYSDRPRVRYNLGMFMEQLGSLLDALGMQQVDLVGLSMGGLIASAFTVQNPGRVRRLALIDPIGTQSMPLNWLYKAALLPGLSELIVSLLGTDRMVEGLAHDFFDPTEVERFRDSYRAQMQFRGFKRAIISTLRNKVVDGSPETYRRLGQLSTPVLLLWGKDDTTLPIKQSQSILDLVPRAEFHAIEHAGHIPNVEQPQQVNPILLDFLSRT